MFKWLTRSARKHVINPLMGVDRARDGINAMTIGEHLGKLKDGGVMQGFGSVFSYAGKDMTGAVGTGADFLKAYGNNRQAVYNAMSKTGSGRQFLLDNNVTDFEGFTEEMMAKFGKTDAKLSAMDMIRLSHTNADGTYSASKIAASAAGSYVTGAAGYRVLSGGGLYKDADGNTNIIGIPGI